MPHQARHERHDLRSSAEALIPERAGLGRLDGEQLRIQLLERIAPDLLVAKLGRATRSEVPEGAV